MLREFSAMITHLMLKKKSVVPIYVYSPYKSRVYQRDHKMTDINTLITAVTPHIPFPNENAAQQFLSQYPESDQAALISALYIGRDHLHERTIQPDYVPESMAFDRYFHTGGDAGQRWLIAPGEFARILYEKNTQLSEYFSAFTLCASASGYNLSCF